MSDVWTKHPLSGVPLDELARNLCAVAAWQEGLDLEQALEAIRSAEAAAYERAARAVENMGDCAACDLADEIRSLSPKETP